MQTTAGTGEQPQRADANAPLPGRRLPGAVRRFIDTEASGGLLLLAAAVVALAWANSPWSASYENLWHTELDLELGRYTMHGDLRHWVNDGLMAIFFFVVGLEIKRELVAGDLRNPRTAALPVFAAVGGMVVPALFFLAVTAGGAGSRGWGIPMATDIAFAIGVVALLGPRVPSSLKLFLLTLAIVDDIGAIVVIAIFYSSDVQPQLLGLAFAALALIVAIRTAGVVWLAPYIALGIMAWGATRASGVHATIAGVALGLLTPALPLAAGTVTRQWAADLDDDPSPAEFDAMAKLAHSSVSPAERLERAFHPWTSFLVIPLFALANAGVEIRSDSFQTEGTSALALAVVVGLVIGKLVGITGASWLAVRCGAGQMPEGATWPMLAGIGAIGGIGFTVSLFIAELAFESESLRDAAKMGVLGASAIAAALGALLLTRACRRSVDE